MRHRTAGPSLYDWEAPSYDHFNEKNSATLNRTLTRIFRRHGAKSILDLACGTGSQVFWLARRGFRVVGCDISPTMLRIARRKARTRNVALRSGDMRTFRAGSFDGAVTISNAVGHLTRSDFERAMRNIRRNLAPGGLYVFDIFNLEWLRSGDHIAKLTIDWIGKIGGRAIRHVQHSTLAPQGVLHSFTTIMTSRVARNEVTLQVYAAAELRTMLRKAGFKKVRFRAIDGSPFSRRRTDRVLAIAQA